MLQGRKLYLSSSLRTRLSQEYDRKARESPVAFRYLVDAGEWTGPPAWARISNVTGPNPFFWDYFVMQGNLEVPWNKEARESLTFGGSAWDGMIGLRAFDRSYQGYEEVSNDDLVSFCDYFALGEGLCAPLPPEQYDKAILVKTEANPGPSFVRIGVKHKADGVSASLEVLRDVLSGELPVSRIGHLLWGLGGRGKPVSIEKILTKIDEGKQVGRAVWMADSLESVFSWRYQSPVTDVVKNLRCGLDIGYNKNDPEQREEMRRLLSGLGFYFSGDWETFDANVPPSLVHFAFRVIRRLFSGSLSQVDDELLNYLEENFIYSYVVCPDGRVRMKSGGVPSGSGLTAIVDTLVNGYVLWKLSHEWCSRQEHLNVRLRGIRVCGDDNLVAFDYETFALDRRFRACQEFKEYLRSESLRRFGMILHPEKSRVSVDPFVKYQVPVVYERVPEHSRAYLKTHPRLMEDDSGFLAPQFGRVQYRIVRDRVALDWYRENGAKRWSYVFQGAVVYLSTSYLSDGTPIRPKPEVIARLASTAARVTNVCEWRALLLQYLVEFWGNEHVYHELMSMLLDTYYMEREGIYTSADALKDIENVLSGRKQYQIRDFLLSRIGKTRGDPGFKGRGWWLARDDWWPDTSDKRFLHLHGQIRGIHEVLGRCKSHGGFGHDELGRLRPVLLGQRRGGTFYLPGPLRVRLTGLMDAWSRVTGQFLSAYPSGPKVAWEGGERAQQLARAFLLGDGRAAVFPYDPGGRVAPLVTEVLSVIIDVSRWGDWCKVARRLQIFL